MRQAEINPCTIRHFQSHSPAEFPLRTDCEHRPIRGLIVAVTFLTLLTAFAIPAIADEPSIYQSSISTSASEPQARSASATDSLARNVAEATGSAFDPSTLPSLDSIDARTDIKVFLQGSVPEELRLAALRRAWTADSTIRDFAGMQENDWDFNDPNGILGFGELGPEIDVEIMVAQILGETSQVAARAPERQPTRFARVMHRLLDLTSIAATAR